MRRELNFLWHRCFLHRFSELKNSPSFQISLFSCGFRHRYTYFCFFISNSKKYNFFVYFKFKTVSWKTGPQTKQFDWLKLKHGYRTAKKINEIYFQCWERYRTSERSEREWYLLDTRRINSIDSKHSCIFVFILYTVFISVLIGESKHDNRTCVIIMHNGGFANNTVYSGPLLTYRLGWGTPPALLLAPPVGNFAPPQWGP